MIKVPDFYDYRIRTGDLEVIVDPYEKPYKMEYLFSTDLTEKGILALHLIIWNNGISDYDLRAAHLRIRSLEGGEFAPMRQTEVAERVLPSTLAQVAKFGALGTAFIFFTVPFAVGAAVDSEVAKRSIRKDYAEKEMKPDFIAPKSVFHGFLFFDLGPDRSAFNRPYYFDLIGLKNEADGNPVDAKIRFELSTK